jgi:hypothetical protein
MARKRFPATAMPDLLASRCLKTPDPPVSRIELRETIEPRPLITSNSKRELPTLQFCQTGQPHCAEDQEDSERGFGHHDCI